MELGEADRGGRARPEFSLVQGGPYAGLSVPYRDYWFWIDDRDLTTSRNFALLMLLFALADTGEKKGLPLLTIPAQ